MAWYDDLPDWFRPRGVGTGSGVASGNTLPPAMPNQQPRMPPPVTSPLSDITSTPAFQVGYPLLAAGLSAAFPVRGTRAVAGLSAGLNTANYYNQLARQQQELQRQEEDRQQLRNKLADFLGSTQATPRPEDTEGPLMESGAFGQAPTVPDSPSKSLAQALNEANQPAAAVKLLEAAMAKPGLVNVAPGGTLYDPNQGRPVFTSPNKPPTQQRPVSVAPGGTLINPETGDVMYEAPALPPPPQRPMNVAPGGTLFDPATGKPIYTAPESPSQRATTAERNARAKRINDLTKTANDPKATAGQLSSAYNALIRDRDSIETPEEDKPVLNEAIRGLRARLAELGKTPGLPPPAAAPGGEMAQMPPAAQHKGKTIRDTVTGKRFKSDGKQWNPIQ